MNEIEQFLAVNGLKQIELADYLGLNKSTISQVVSGKARLSQGKINQLRMNDKGWDCSMFPEGRIVQTIGNHSPYASNSNGDCELWKKLCEEKDKRIAILEDYITLLQSKIEN